MTKPARMVFWAAIIIAAFSSGWLVRSNTSAERLARTYAKYVKGKPSHKVNLAEDGIFPMVAANDYRHALIGLQSPADITTRRAALGAFIWRGTSAPGKQLPDGVETDVFEPLLFDLDNLASVDRLTVAQAYGIDSVAFHLKAKDSQSCLMVYQEGHRDSFLVRKRFFDKVLSAGCDVLALSLPATGPHNPRPTFHHSRFGVLTIHDPDALEILETEGFGTTKLFITPVLVALNHVLAQRSYAKVGMTGFSGGGWVTQLVAALDPRITYSYAVAGSAPLAVHASRPSWGSYEQLMGRLYEIVTYPELYVMGASGSGRRQLQAFNREDPCCFAGENWRAYAGAVAEKARKFGGRFRVVMDSETVRHTLSQRIEDTIMDDFMPVAKPAPEGSS
ncbi:MAG: hypothetical protein H7Y60_13910 [Rhodospirillaceae bacterium]|nr:hypothetical protein [Rhodospirillales bacterium]